mmetsp:Transcript_21044/g.45903  ORF Transcript_21044/g.45903 Transcript_21044/m.45903 type:complete len:183 (+) Transcript_21044:105-653(+)
MSTFVRNNCNDDYSNSHAGCCDFPQDFGVILPFPNDGVGMTIDRPSPKAFPVFRSVSMDDDDNDNDTSSVNTMSTSDAAHVGSTHSHNSARRRIARFGSFDSTGSSGSSAFRAVPRMIGLRPIITKKPTPTRSAIARREHHRSSKRNDVVHLPVLLRRRPVADFSFDETNGEIPDHLLFPIL